MTKYIVEYKKSTSSINFSSNSKPILSESFDIEQDALLFLANLKSNNFIGHIKVRTNNIFDGYLTAPYIWQ